jgi:hypothetical protein
MHNASNAHATQNLGLLSTDLYLTRHYSRGSRGFESVNSAIRGRRIVLSIERNHAGDS